MSILVSSVALDLFYPTRNELGVLGFWVFFGVEPGGDIKEMESSVLGITNDSPPIHAELSFGYTLVPLSASLDMVDFYDVFDIFDVGVTSYSIALEDIMTFDIGGVGLGVASV